LAPAALGRLQTKNGKFNKNKKKEIPSIMFSVFLVLDDDKMKKDILMDAVMKCYEKSPTNIPFLVWRTTTTSQSILTATSYTSTSPAARGWDEDDAPFDLSASWDPYNPIGVIDTFLQALLSSLKSP
jgi:hypothetical protein